MNIYNEAFVYKWTNTTNNYIYIGYHKGSPDDGYVCSSKSDRFWRDFNDPSQPFVRDILAYGTCREMVLLERKLLNEVDIKSDSVYNNGNGGLIFTDEVRRKMSESGRKKKLSDEHKKKISVASKKHRHTDEVKMKISESKLGSKNPMYQKEFSEEHRARLSKSRKNKPRAPMSETSKKKMSLTKSGVPLGPPSAEHRAKLSEALKGIIWINNGVQVRGVKDESLIPDGWVKGQLNRRKKTK